jgi:single-stranded-DNA-specific exonuclease
VVEPRFRWVFPAPLVLTPEFASAAGARGISDRMATLLARRGVMDRVELDAWFAEPLDGLHDPASLPDADRLLARLTRARADGERVLVFGDFDADGLTGLTIMTLALRRFGVAVEPYVPSRLDEGHGLSVAAIDAAEATGATVIVTVDCGSTSHAEIATARDRGLDVIVTDHHRVPQVLPDAIALVNPHRADSTYPDPRLAGSGVAFKVAQLLLRDEPGGPAFALTLTDLATIGSVADVAPVVGENRAIARLGLERLRSAPRPGIAALLERARVAPAAVDLETVSFALAPRLNAAGRVGEAMEAARLLLADDAAEAATHADALEVANAERRDLMKTAVAEARALVADTPDAPATLVRGPWGVGIVGLVAARLAEDRGRAAVVGADLGDIIRASCRSDGAMDLGATLEQCGDLFIRYGGHAGAAGFELSTDRWDEFSTRFLALAAVAAPADPRVALPIDLALPARDVDYALFREFAGLTPAGPGNPDPLVAVLGLTVTRVRAATGGHTQLTLRRERDVLDGIAFGRADLAETVREGDRVDVVARLASRVFGGYETLQLEIRDVCSSGHHEAIRVAADRTAAVLGTLSEVPA